MTVYTAKTHYWEPAGMIGLDEGKTSCGIRCWLSRTVASEAETARGSRIDITRKPHLVTCETCKSKLVQPAQPQLKGI